MTWRPDCQYGAPAVRRRVGRKIVAAWAAVFLLLTCSARAVSVAPEEMAAAKQWLQSRFDALVPPFSFTYGGQSSAELLPTWKREKVAKKLDDQGTEWPFLGGTHWTRNYRGPSAPEARDAGSEREAQCLSARISMPRPQGQIDHLVEMPWTRKGPIW